MVQFKSAFFIFVAALLVSAGSLLADNSPPVAKDQANTGAPAPIAAGKANSGVGAPVASKPAKPENPTMTAMRGAIALAEAGKTDKAVAAYEKIRVLKSKKIECWRLNNEDMSYL